MVEPASLGELEHVILLAVMKLGNDARARTIRELLRTEAGRRLSRGALYTTLDRLETKKLLSWKVERATPARGGIPRRVFSVTSKGVAAVRRAQRALARLSEGIPAL